jgi:hypothetical protein
MMRARSSLALHRAVRQGCCSTASSRAGAATTSATATHAAAALQRQQSQSQQQADGTPQGLGISTSSASSSTAAAAMTAAAAVRAGVARRAATLPLQWPMQPQRTFSVETGGAVPTHEGPPPPLDPPVGGLSIANASGIT